MQQPVKLTFDTPVTEAARQILDGQMKEILEQIARVPSEDQSISEEAVHDLRVALRRSLAILAALAPWFDRAWLKKQTPFYRELLRLLGHVRDADILAHLAESYFHEEPGADLAGGPELLADLCRTRDLERKKLCLILSGKDFRKKLGALTIRLNMADVTLKMVPAGISGKGEVRLFRFGECLPVMLYQAAASLTVYHTVVRYEQPDLPSADEAGQRENKASDSVSVETVDESVLHQLRIAAKNFRYIAEYGQSLLGSPGRALVRDFRIFQDVLGNWHDSVVACTAFDRPGMTQGRTEHEKEAVRSWRLYQESQRDNLRLSFMEIWEKMTPAWFHERLSAGLISLFSEKAD